MDKKQKGDTFGEIEDVVSLNECTGLIAALPETEAEDRSLSELYGIHSGKKPDKRYRTK